MSKVSMHFCALFYLQSCHLYCGKMLWPDSFIYLV